MAAVESSIGISVLLYCMAAVNSFFLGGGSVVKRSCSRLELSSTAQLFALASLLDAGHFREFSAFDN